MHWNADWHMGWMGLGWILIVPVLIAVVWFALSAARRNGSTQKSPEEVLKGRYANGEIDRETHERMLEDLLK
jgi:uncharacterized membrane protein